MTVLPVTNHVVAISCGSMPQIQKPTTEYSPEPQRYYSFIYIMFFLAEVLQGVLSSQVCMNSLSHLGYIPSILKLPSTKVSSLL
jgi:hypothetical protein